jgi:hypothetical protein
MKLLRVVFGICGLLLPAFGLDREVFTFTKYDLIVRIEPEQQRLGVRGKITLRNDSATPQRSLSLQISSSLSWRSITADGKPLQFLTQPYTSDIDHTGKLAEAIVSLPRECPPKGEVVLEVGYEGTISLDGTRLTSLGVPADAARHSDWDQISRSFSAVRGAGYVAWYPVAMEAASLTDSSSVPEAVGRWKAREAQAEMRLNINETGENPGAIPQMTCNADSPQEADENLGRAWQHSIECSFRPLGTAAPLFVIANYGSLKSTAVDVSYLDDRKAVATEYAQAAEKVSPFITDWFGKPRRKPQVFELQDAEAAPYETSSILLTPLNHSGAAMELTAAHQLAHAAFNSPRLWIYEGLAHFAQALYLEHEDGRQAALDFMEAHRAVLVDTEKSLAAQRPSPAAGQSLIDTGLEDLYRSKALYFWWMLRDMVTAPVLKLALADYQPDQDREPRYLQSLIDKEARRDLQWFFDDWVYHDKGLPDFRVASVFSQQTPSGTYLLTVTVENLGGAGAEVPVTVRAEGGQATQRLEVRGRSKNSVRITVPSTPLEVTLNDGSIPESDMSNNVYKVPLPAEHP